MIQKPIDCEEENDDCIINFTSFLYLLFLFSLHHTISIYRRDFLEDIVEKGENAGNEHFLLFLQCLVSYTRQK